MNKPTKVPFKSFLKRKGTTASARIGQMGGIGTRSGDSLHQEQLVVPTKPGHQKERFGCALVAREFMAYAILALTANGPGTGTDTDRPRNLRTSS
jgi:hypothetical protein